MANTAGPILETPRLILRPLQPQDFEPWAAFAADEEVMATLGGVQPRAVAWRGFMSVAGSWAMKGFAMFSVIEKASGAWVGRLGPWEPEGWPGHEVGWGLTRATWGKGYATEGASAAIDWAFDHLGWTDIIHCIETTNVNSQNVAKRLGSSVLRMGRMPPPYDDHDIQIWGQSREQWRARPRG
jgi:RimJ/RimL family protein N-acetyltransferase